MDVGRVLVRTGAHAVLRCADDHWRHGRAATGDESLVHSLRMATIRWIDRAWPVAFAVGCGAMLVAVFVWGAGCTRLVSAVPVSCITGLHCPGCGSLRAVRQFLHGELWAAFRLNPLMVLSLPLLAFAVVSAYWPALATAVGRPHDVAARLADSDSGCRAALLAAAESAVRAVFVTRAAIGLAVSPEGAQKSTGGTFVSTSSSGPIPDIKSRNSTGGQDSNVIMCTKQLLAMRVLVW